MQLHASNKKVPKIPDGFQKILEGFAFTCDFSEHEGIPHYMKLYAKNWEVAKIPEGSHEYWMVPLLYIYIYIYIYIY